MIGFLTVIHSLLILSIVIMTIAFIIGILNQNHEVNKALTLFPLYINEVPTESVQFNDGHMEIELEDAIFNLHVFPLPIYLRIFNHSAKILTLLLILYIISLFRQILMTLIDGDPFTKTNAVKLKKIGMVILLGSMFYIIVETVLNGYFNSKITLNNIKLSSNLLVPFFNYLDYIIAGIVFIIFSEIFRIGTSLKEEQDLTV